LIVFIRSRSLGSVFGGFEFRNSFRKKSRRERTKKIRKRGAFKLRRGDAVPWIRPTTGHRPILQSEKIEQKEREESKKNREERERQEGNERKRVLHPLYTPSNRFGSPGLDPGLNRTGTQPVSNLVSPAHVLPRPNPLFYYSAFPLLLHAPLPCMFYYFNHSFLHRMFNLHHVLFVPLHFIFIKLGISCYYASSFILAFYFTRVDLECN